MGAEEAGSVEALMERLVRRGRLMDAERAFRKWAFAVSDGRVITMQHSQC